MPAPLLIAEYGYTEYVKMLYRFGIQHKALY